MSINSPERDIIKSILLKYLSPQEVKVYLFGSRVSGGFRKNSDLDILIEGINPIPFSILGKLREDFEQSDLPYRVDIVDAKTIDENFRSKIHPTLEKLEL